MSGYVRIHRSLLGHPAFRNESETMAFAWLIAKAAWKPTRVRYKGHAIGLKRGQLAISQRDMAAAFDRDKAWIGRLIQRLKSETMIETRTEAGVSLITICNYDGYQAENENGEAGREAAHEAGNEAAPRQRRGTEQRKEEQKNIDRSDARERSLPADVRSVMEEGGFISPPPDLGLMREWYAIGATLEQDIIPTVRAVRARLSKPPFKLKVFDAAIREKLAADAAAIDHLRKVAERNKPEVAQDRC